MNETKKVKLAVYKGNYSENVHEFSDYIEGEYARVSNYIEVEFVPLPETIQLQNEVARLDREMEETKQEAMERLTRLEEKKKELLALSFQES